jgi:hypothetical protein
MRRNAYNLTMNTKVTELSETENMLLRMVADSDSEYRKMVCARRSAKDRTDGFQGCKLCDFDGFYLCRYSPEGLCKKCEVKHFPERFHACLFCRRPQQYGGSCLTCSSSFGEWVERTVHSTTGKDIQHILQQAAHRLSSEGGLDNKFINRDSTLSSNWEGFYASDNRWVIPNIQIRSDREFEWKTCHDDLYKVLLDHGIDIYAEYQIAEPRPVK